MLDESANLGPFPIILSQLYRIGQWVSGTERLALNSNLLCEETLSQLTQGLNQHNTREGRNLNV